MPEHQSIEVIQDSILELEIQLAGKRMELFLSMADSLFYSQAQRNQFKAEAQCWRRRMERFIGDRRPQAVAQMEEARGLTQ